MSDHLGESMEDYLEAILVLEDLIENVRSVDVASYLGFSKPSVSHAVKLMEQKGLIRLNSSKILHLTPEGEEIARSTYQRHCFFTDMLKSIGVDSKTAAEDACRIEHVISEETFQAIRRFYMNKKEDC